MRRAFTLIELIIAGTIAAMIAGTLAASFSNLGTARESARRRLDAAVRADAALEAMRREIVSVVRTDDLFYTYFLIEDDGGEDADFDELLLFNTRLRSVRNTANYAGDGQEYETAFRIEQLGSDLPTLWRRRDTMPDEFWRGGGQARPVAEGIVSLSIRAWDGDEWLSGWDSDRQGLPLGVEIVITATGAKPGEDPWDAPLVDLRTVVPIDRVPPPRDHFEEIELLLAEELAEEQGGAGAGDGATGESGGNGLQPGGIQPGGGGRPGIGGGGGGRPGIGGGGGGRPTGGGGGRPTNGGGGGRPTPNNTGGGFGGGPR